MEKAYEARISKTEAARLLLTFSARAYVWANNNELMAQTLSGRKMVLIHLEDDEFVLIVDESLFQSETFWAEAFWGLEKYIFNEYEAEWDEAAFDIGEETELIGNTSPMSFNDDTYIEPSYEDLCKRLGVTPIDLESEKAEELKVLQPLIEDGTLSEYDAECIAWSIINKINRGDLDEYELQAARIDAIVERKKWDILNDFKMLVEGKFPTPPPQPSTVKRPRKPKAERDADKPPRRRKEA